MDLDTSQDTHGGGMSREEAFAARKQMTQAKTPDLMARVSPPLAEPEVDSKTDAGRILTLADVSYETKQMCSKCWQPIDGIARRKAKETKISGVTCNVCNCKYVLFYRLPDFKEMQTALEGLSLIHI